MANADWPTLTNIYKPVKVGDHNLILKASLVSAGRTRGHLAKPTEILRRGQRAMETLVYTDYHDNGHFEQ